MTKIDSVRIDVDAASIPKMSYGGKINRYDNINHEIRLGKKTYNEILVSAFDQFSPKLSDYDNGKKNYIETLHDDLPVELLSSCIVIKHKIEIGTYPVVSLFINPKDLPKFIAFFVKHAEVVYDKDPGTARVIKSFVSDLRKVLTSNEHLAARDPDEFAHIQKTQEKIWNVILDEMKKPEGSLLQEYKRRIKIHETSHYITLRNKWEGNSGQIFDNTKGFIFRLNSRYSRMSEDEKPNEYLERLAKIQKIYKLFNMIQAGLESEAIANEILGSLIVTNGEDYSHFFNCDRLLSVLSLYKEVEGQEDENDEDENDLDQNVVSQEHDNDLMIDYLLRTDEVPYDKFGNTDFLVHATGILLLLFSEDIDINQFLQTLDFSQITPGNDLKSEVLFRINHLVDNPNEAKKLLLNSYDFIQELLKSLVSQFNEEFVELFAKYPDLVNFFDEKELVKLKNFRQFLDKS